METNEKIAEVLNDLITINNNRIEGYQVAINDTSWDDSDLSLLFNFYIVQTEGFNKRLQAMLIAYKGQPSEEGTTLGGRLHRMWMELKLGITGNDRKSILEECERIEDGIKKAYGYALDDAQNFPLEVKELIEQIATDLMKGHDRIRVLRDAQPS